MRDIFDKSLHQGCRGAMGLFRVSYVSALVESITVHAEASCSCDSESGGSNLCKHGTKTLHVFPSSNERPTVNKKEYRISMDALLQLQILENQSPRS